MNLQSIYRGKISEILPAITAYMSSIGETKYYVKDFDGKIAHVVERVRYFKKSWTVNVNNLGIYYPCRKENILKCTEWRKLEAERLQKIAQIEQKKKEIFEDLREEFQAVVVNYEHIIWETYSNSKQLKYVNGTTYGRCTFRGVTFEVSDTFSMPPEKGNFYGMSKKRLNPDDWDFSNVCFRSRIFNKILSYFSQPS